MSIPSTNSQLLVTEDWKKIYQSFRNADFQSYDFESIRRILISYLQENYPEDFNDYIDSSEYIALVDLIAYLGQNLSFRIDLNARENFLETAQRRDSILRLAQLISYVPKRNIPASGLLKITAVSTTENVIDSSGVNLANTPVAWSDPTNSNWYQQFVSVINAAMPGSMIFGQPNDRADITGLLTEQYLINSSNTDIPVYSFVKNINGTSMTFEIVPAAFSGKKYIYEDSPKPAKSVSLIYQDDNQGSSSGGTGFFALFKQGTLSISNFAINHPVTNEIIGINSNNINNTDVWLWQLDAGNKYSTLWSQTPSTVGNNVIYNSLDSSIRTVYSVTSRDNDQIDLNFADGSFGDLPKGKFVLYYRQSNGLTYAIKPEQMAGISIKVPYVNKAGQPNTLTLTLGLQYTVTNSAAPESNQSIQLKAPQAYYTQNRMVTGEDYNIAPLAVTSNVLKVKSIARTVSGISKYFELSDVSGKYSATNVFATDGVLYKDINEKNFSFGFSNKNAVFSAFKSQLAPVLSSASLSAFYYDTFVKSKPITPATDPITPDFKWALVNTVSGQSRGYFLNKFGSPASVGASAGTGNALSYVSAGTMIKFVPPAGYYFLPGGKLTTAQSVKTTSYVWTTVLQVVGDGSNYGLGELGDGTGPIILSDLLPANSVVAEIVPPFIETFTTSFENDLANLCMTQRNFGLRFDSVSRSWKVILDSNLDLFNPFSFSNEADTTNTNKDSSWLIAFSWQGDSYKVRYRLTDFIFHSVNQTGFFVDSSNKNFDYTTNRVIKDKIDVLSINPDPENNSTGLGIDYAWQVDSSIVESDGYLDPSKVKVSFYNNQNAGKNSQKIDPSSFNKIVGSLTTGTSIGYVLFQLQADGVTYQLSTSPFVVYTTETQARNAIARQASGDLFYIAETNVVKSVNGNSLVYEPTYTAYPGRDDLKFHYQHNSGQERRIDPSKSNIIDVYMLTSAYDSEFRNWLSTQVGARPSTPTSQELENNYSASLEPIKTISDEIVYQPVTYKILFGSAAPISLQAKFKAVKNPASTTSNNDIVSRILSAINNFFALENWDFGQSFHFSELSAYVMNLLTPDITNFVIVPTVNNFGSLYEISCQSNEIFISGATAADISVISAMTASQLNVTSIVTNSSNQ